MSNTMLERLLLSGNEAVARGAADAGVRVAAAYPGTPSTEILENLVHYPGVDANWSPNEKVALEVGMGAAFAGARVLVTMKHVGVNVAADPLFTLSYTGIRGGLVLISADDPGMHSSQNEQDNRRYAPFAKIPMLEPADSQEAYEYTRLAFDISEQFDTPVMIRMTTRVCHGKSVVLPSQAREASNGFHFERDQAKFVMVPAYARRRHALVQERTALLAEYAESSPVNRIEARNPALGVITSGVCYQYVREVLPDAGVLKLGMTHPLPRKMIEGFAASVRELYVVEELEPYLEDQLLAWGIACQPRPVALRQGELDPDRLKDMFGLERSHATTPEDLPARPPVLCPGCPHRPVFTVLKKLKLVATGDIGCYTLGALPPLSAVDTCVCMGAGIGHALGLSKVLPPDEANKVVAVIGDSTFVHSGITSLIDIVYNNAPCTVIILDNRTTAMTGRQDHPATGRNLSGEPAPEMDLEAVCRAVGVQDVSVVDPWDIEQTQTAVKAALAHPGPSVVIARGPCVLIDRKKAVIPLEVSNDECKDCGLCARTGCPAIARVEGGYRIDPTKCRGCGLCRQLCKFGAIGYASC